MSRNLSELARATKEIQLQIQPYIQKNPRFAVLDHYLCNLLEIIEQRKLLLQLFCQTQSQADTIIELLKEQKALSSACHFFAHPQPAVWSLHTALFTAALRANTPNQEILLLDPSLPYQLGRDADCSIPISNHYHFVSQYHGQIFYDLSAAIWMIEDNSKNGTFVDAERLEPHKKYPLQHGQSIILGSDAPAEGCLEFVFDYPKTKSSGSRAKKTTASFDLACFIFSFGKNLNEDEVKQIETVRELNKKYLHGLIVVDEKAQTGLPFNKETAKSFLDYIKRTTSISQSKLAYVNLQDLADQPGSPFIGGKHIFQKLVSELEKEIQKSGEAVLTKKLNFQFDQIEAIAGTLIENEKTILSQASESHVLGKKKMEEEHFKAQIAQAITYINHQQTTFFKQAEDYLAKFEKTDEFLFDSLFADSLPCRMQSFSQKLKPYVNKQGNKKILQLKYTISQKTASNSIHRSNSSKKDELKILGANTAMLHFCENELYEWAKKLWDEISSNLASGGLKQLYSDVFDAIEPISERDLTQVKAGLDLRAFVIPSMPDCELNYTQVTEELVIKEPSALTYLMKKVRSQWMQFIFLFSFFSILGFAGRRQIMRNIMAPIIDLFNKAPVISSIVLIAIIFFAIRLGYRVYQEELAENRNKQANEIRTKLCKHYQELVKKHLFKQYLGFVQTKLEEERTQIAMLQEYLNKHT